MFSQCVFPRLLDSLYEFEITIVNDPDVTRKYIFEQEFHNYQ